MRFEGVVKFWNDDRGVGFIAPGQGPQEVFVYIKVFKGLRIRPQLGQRVIFQVEVGPKGGAFNGELVQYPGRATHGVHRKGFQRWGVGSLLTLPVLLVVLLAGYMLGHAPRWSLWVYPVASALIFSVYASDKSAAKNGTWRRAEKKRYLLAFIGGWPGALVAQKVLRHKSSKAGIRAVFWGTVVLNLIVFIVLRSLMGNHLHIYEK